MLTPKIVTELKQYSRAKALADLFAGLTVGVVALPLAMAFAIASGLPPERGLFTAIVAGFLISALGGSKVQIGGPTGAFVVLVSSIVMQFGYGGLAVCTVLAGILLILFGLFRFGGLIKFIPFPVTTGFTSGIAVVIFSSQISDLLGLRLETTPAEFLGKWHAYAAHIDTVNYQAAAIGIGTVLVILLIQRLWPKLPAMLIGMLVATVVASLFHLNVETIGSRFGDLPRVLPVPIVPTFSFENLGPLIKPAFTIALLAAIESLLSASVADGMIGGRHRPNIELIGQGVANIASPLFGGIPATGAIARTATNVKSGGKTPVAGIVHALMLALVLLLFAPAAKAIPLAALAAILVVVSYNMSEARHFATLLRGPKSDAFVLLLTFILTVLVDLTVAVEVGVVLAAVLFIRRMAELTNVEMITKELRGDDEEEGEDQLAIATREVPAGVEVFEINGPLFFGMIDTFNNAMQSIKRPPKVLIIRTRQVLSVDATAIHVLRGLHRRCNKSGTLLLFSGIQPQPLAVFEDTGFLEEIGRENVLENIDVTLDRARAYLANLEANKPEAPVTHAV